MAVGLCLPGLVGGGHTPTPSSCHAGPVAAFRLLMGPRDCFHLFIPVKRHAPPASDICRANRADSTSEPRFPHLESGEDKGVLLHGAVTRSGKVHAEMLDMCPLPPSGHRWWIEVDLDAFKITGVESQVMSR